MRRLYRKRQQQLREVLAEELGVPYELFGGEGGLHLTVAIEGIDDEALVQLARYVSAGTSGIKPFLS